MIMVLIVIVIIALTVLKITKDTVLNVVVNSYAFLNWFS